MEPLSTVSDWLERLQAGDRAATQKLWERFYQRMVRVARRQLRSVPRRATNEEDVALEAFNSFYEAIVRGRYPDLHDRTGLWRVLLALTVNKACDLIRHEAREKRCWRRTVLLSEAAGPEAGAAALAQMFADTAPDPGFAVELADRVEWLLAQLGDDRLRQIVLRKLEGYANLEIAAEQGCALSAVERRLRLIRQRLEVWLGAAVAGGPPPG